MKLTSFIYFSVILYLPLILALNTEIFQIPNKKFVTVNESVTIICRGIVSSLENFMLKRHDIIISLQCSNWGKETFDIKCNKVGSWEYMNLTISRINWGNRGEYICVNDQQVAKLDLSVSVPVVISMKLGEITYNGKQVHELIQNQDKKLKGKGSKDEPFRLIPREIQSVHINCSSNLSFPPAKLQWTITQLFPDGKISSPKIYEEINSIKILSNETNSLGLSQTTSVFELDCQKLKLHSLLKVRCSNINNTDEENMPNYYFLCPDLESFQKANSSLARLKKFPGKITTGETVNIVIGCLIGTILLISGIVLICRHRTKDDIDRYTMRQNNMEHSGYRV